MRSVAAVATVLGLLMTGCTTPPEATPRDDDEAQALVDVSWREAALPRPPGPPGRVVLRDAVRCGGEWYVVGGVVRDGRASRPAAWSSTDGATWRSLPLTPRTYWGRRSVLLSVGCSAGAVAVVGAQTGTGHVPRVTTWFRGAGGALVDVDAPFTLFGGAGTTNVGPLEGGPDGFLVVGNRAAGPAVWLSPDARRFRVVEGAPGLSEGGAGAMARDQVHDGSGWTVVGEASEDGRMERVPRAWWSSDGEAWVPQQVPGAEGYTGLEQVVRYGEGLVALGIREEAFGVWTRVDGAWETVGTFGSLTDAQVAPYVASMTTVGAHLLATTSDRAELALWSSADATSWRRVQVPVRLGAGGDHALVVTGAAGGGEGAVLLVLDDGRRGRVWRADW